MINVKSMRVVRKVRTKLERWHHQYVSRLFSVRGNVFSPILYNLYVSSLENNINPACKILQYADDIVIYSKNSSIDAGLSAIENGVKECSSFLSTLGLSLAVQKTKLCIFSRNNNAITKWVTNNGKRSKEHLSFKFRLIMFLFLMYKKSNFLD